MQTTGVAVSQFLKQNKTKQKPVLQPSLGIASLACEHGRAISQLSSWRFLVPYKTHFAGLAKSMYALSPRCFSFPSRLVNVWLLPLGLQDVYSHKKRGVISVIPLIRDAGTLKSPYHSYLCFHQHLWQQQPRNWEEMERGRWSWKPQVFSYPLWYHFCSNFILAHRSTAVMLTRRNLSFTGVFRNLSLLLLPWKRGWPTPLHNILPKVFKLCLSPRHTGKAHNLRVSLKSGCSTQTMIPVSKTKVAWVTQLFIQEKMGDVISTNATLHPLLQWHSSEVVFELMTYRWKALHFPTLRYLFAQLQYFMFPMALLFMQYLMDMHTVLWITAYHVFLQK